MYKQFMEHLRRRMGRSTSQPSTEDVSEDESTNNNRKTTQQNQEPASSLIPDLPNLIAAKPPIAQSQSPLFALPAEIRNYIFDLILSPTEITDKAYRRAELYCRPGYTCPKKIYTSFLRTCRAAYLEGWNIPMSKATFDFWYKWDMRCPPKRNNPEVFNSKIAASLIPYMDHVNIFAQMLAWPEVRRDFDPDKLRSFRPKRLTLTVRHEDWWNWENKAPLTLQERDFVYLNVPESVQVLILELETVRRKVPQLTTIIERVTDRQNPWMFTRQDGIKLIPFDSKVPSYKWSRPKPYKEYGTGAGQAYEYFVSEVIFKPAVLINDYLSDSKERNEAAETTLRFKPTR